MTKLEILKWIGTFFIILFPIVSAYEWTPQNFLVLSTGTGLWMIAGIIQKDRPMIFVNVVSTTLNIVAYIKLMIG